MPFKPFYGTCPLCPANRKVLIVVKNGLCKFHNEEKKNKGKKPKPPKPKKLPKPKIKYGQCLQCPANTPKLLATKYLCHYHNEQKKKEAKSKRIVKLVDKAEKKKGVKYLKKELDRIFSLYIRNLGAKDGKNKCFTCNTELPIEELQCGHYESRRFLALRYEISNNHCQCYMCNIVKKGNYTIYALRMIDKYGKEHLDLLSIKKNNVIKWGRFEYEVMITEFTEKLSRLIEANKK